VCAERRTKNQQGEGVAEGTDGKTPVQAKQTETGRPGEPALRGTEAFSSIPLEWRKTRDPAGRETKELASQQQRPMDSVNAMARKEKLHSQIRRDSTLRPGHLITKTLNRGNQNREDNEHMKRSSRSSRAQKQKLNLPLKSIQYSYNHGGHRPPSLF
jgi:hypothetical protein